MGKPNPFADYPPHFTRAFAAAFGLTALAVGYTYVNNWQDVVAGALLFRAMGNNLGVVLMLLMAGALFGRIRLVNVPVILYGFVTIGFSLMLLLGWDTLEAKMAKDSTGIIGLAALILAAHAERRIELLHHLDRELEGIDARLSDGDRACLTIDDSNITCCGRNAADR